MPVPAFTSAPIASNASSISSELKRSVPLNSRCSRKCEMPACSWPSSRDPARIQKPSAIERTEGIASVATLTPDSSVVTWLRCSVDHRSTPLLARRLAQRSSVRLRSRSAVAPATAAALATASAVPATAAVTAIAAVTTAARALVAGAHRGELFLRLARHVRVLGEAQADAAALAVHLDDLHA